MDRIAKPGFSVTRSIWSYSKVQRWYGALVRHRRFQLRRTALKGLEYLDVEMRGIQDVEKQIEVSVTYLQEYRAALVTAAVTGQIDGLR